MDRIRVKVATLNLWDAGSHVDGPLEKQLRVVLTQGLDVVALQETGGTAASALAEALGWDVYQSDGSLGIVSRHPLSDVTAPTADLPAAAGTVRLPGGRSCGCGRPSWTRPTTDRTRCAPAGPRRRWRPRRS